MSGGFKRPGQGSRTGKAQPFSSRGGAKKGGNKVKDQGTRKDATVAPPSCSPSSATWRKRGRDDDGEETGIAKKARVETHSSPTDLSAFRAPINMPVTISGDPNLADFFGSDDGDEDMEFEDVDLTVEPVDDSLDHNLFNPGLCSSKAADTNVARYRNKHEKEREGRGKYLDTIAEVAAIIPHLAVNASYNAYPNCPFRDSQIVPGQAPASRGEDRFEDGVLSLEGDKQYLSWTRFGSDHAVIYLQAAELTHIKWKGDGDFAGIEVHKSFPEGLEGPADTKVYDFLFQGEDACQNAKAFWSALKTLRKVSRPDPITIPAFSSKSERGIPTPADSGYSGSPPPTAAPIPSKLDEHGHTPEEIAANNASTLIYRTALSTHGTGSVWPAQNFTKPAMIAFLTSKDNFHNITDSTAWARGLGSKSKAIVQAKVISYLQCYPLEGAIAVPTAEQIKEGKKPKWTPHYQRGREEKKEWNGVLKEEKFVVKPGLFAAKHPEGKLLGYYRTNEEALRVVQEVMVRDAQEVQRAQEMKALLG